MTDHFDGERFHNQGDVEPASPSTLLKWAVQRKPKPWPAWIESQPGPPPPPGVGRGELRVTFVNHATALLQIDGVNILTDPVWSERVGPLSWVGSARVRAPGIRFEDLPPIHAVAISHNHYDHLDLPTLVRLHRAHNPRFFVGLGLARLLEEEGIDKVEELDWWEYVRFGPIRVTAVPAQHFSMRGLCDAGTSLWVGWVIEGEGGPVYFAGDTGFGPHFAQIHDEFGPMRLALLPIAPTTPRCVMAPVHVSASEAVAAHSILRAQTSVAIHFGTFRQADDGPGDALQELQSAMRESGTPAESFWALGFGEGRNVPPRKLARPHHSSRASKASAASR